MENKDIRWENSSLINRLTIICKHLTERTSHEHKIVCLNSVDVSLLIKLHEFWPENLIYIVRKPRKNLSHAAH